MKRTSNKNCGKFVANKEEFKASNLSGVWKGDIYFVLSYGWYPILMFNGHWTKCQLTISQTTRMHLRHATSEIVVQESADLLNIYKKIG